MPTTYKLKNPTGAPSEAAFNWMVTLARQALTGEPAMLRDFLIKAAGYNAQQVSSAIDFFKMAAAHKSAGGEAGAVEVSKPAQWVPGKYLVNGKVYVLKVGKGSGAAYLLSEEGEYLGAKKGDAPAVLAAIAEGAEKL